MAHLHPTAELTERALLPDDPGQALALTRVLFEETPRMFNHHRGLWGYSGIALDGAPLTVQSTGVGGPSAAIVVAELAALGLRRAVRIGRAWAIDDAVAASEVVAATEIVAADGASRALGAARTVRPDRALAEALDADRTGALVSVDLVEPSLAAAAASTTLAMDALAANRPLASGPLAGQPAVAFDLESAAVVVAARRAGIPAACLVAIEGAADADAVAERLGRSALCALAPVRV